MARTASPSVRSKASRRSVAPPDHGADRRRVVLEREVDVPRLRPRDVRDLAVQGDLAEPRPQRLLDPRRQLGDRLEDQAEGVVRAGDPGHARHRRDLDGRRGPLAGDNVRIGRRSGLLATLPRPPDLRSRRSIQWTTGGGKLARARGARPGLAAERSGRRPWTRQVRAGREFRAASSGGSLLVAAGVLAVVAWMLGPDFSSWPGAGCRREFRRRAAFLYLDALLIGYAVALVGRDRPDRRRAGDAEAVAGRCAGPAPATGPAAGAGRRDPAEPAGPRRRRGRLERLAAADVPAAGACRPRPGAPNEPPGRTTPGRRSCPSRLPRRPSAPVPPGALRILVIGESSARGEPYHPWLSVGQIAAWKLESVFPGRPVRVDVWAYGGATIRQMHERLAGLTYRPDALILYVGHNEFAARFPWMREPGGYYDDDMPSLYSPAVADGRAALLAALPAGAGDLGSPADRPAAAPQDHPRAGRPAGLHAGRVRGDPRRVPPSARGDRRVLRDDRHAADLHHPGVERRRLRPQPIGAARRDAARRARSRSPGTSTAPAAWRSRPRRGAAARSRAGRAPPRVRRDPLPAGPAAGAGRRLGRGPPALRRWPARATACPCAAPRTSAAPTARWPPGTRRSCWSTAPKVLEAASEHGIARRPAVPRRPAPEPPRLRRAGAGPARAAPRPSRLRLAGGSGDSPVEAEDCARHFGIDADRWAEICRREAEFYEVTAYIRYDPTFRLSVAKTTGAPPRRSGPDAIPARPVSPAWAARRRLRPGRMPYGRHPSPLIAGRPSTYFPRPSPVVVEVCRSA